VQTFVFDCFGVICSEVAPFVLADHLPPQTVRLVKDTIILEADLGHISEPQMFEQLSEVMGLPPRRIEEEYWSHVQIDDGVVEIVKKLRAGHKLAFLSNSPSSFVREILARRALDGLFDTIMVSAEEGIAKPDPAIFKRLLARMAVEPRDAVMIDDKPPNIAGARAIGMDGMLFESAEKLARDLTALYSVTL